MLNTHLNTALLFRCFAFFMTIFLTLPASLASAEETVMDKEVDYLINAITQSQAVFIRNGTEHSSSEAADHLRMKYKRGKKYLSSAEDFIEKVATKSSITKKPYWIIEPGQAKQESAVWLSKKLALYRQP